MTPLYGHDEAVAAFRAGLDGGRLHHAWLVTGAEGTGKALFADKAALRVLAQGAGPPVDAPGLDVPDSHPTAKLVAAGSHPDLMRLERLTRDSGTELARSITVDQVRGLQRLFTTTASMSPWRVVVIDSIDDLERNAANALLKNLEEPPPSTVFLLVSHSPERLLPTIRSRCRLFGSAASGRHDVSLARASPTPRGRGRAPVDGEGAPGRGSPRGSTSSLDSDGAGRGRSGHAAVRRRRASAGSAQPRYEASGAGTGEARRAARAEGVPRPAIGQERASRLAGTARRLSLDPQALSSSSPG